MCDDFIDYRSTKPIEDIDLFEFLFRSPLYESRESYKVPLLEGRRRLDRNNTEFNNAVLGTIDDAIVQNREMVIRISVSKSDPSKYFIQTYESKAPSSKVQ